MPRADEAESPDPELHVARLTIDLFRPEPKQLLHTHTRTVRQGHRIAVLEASLFSGELEVARATALLLRPSQPLPLKMQSTKWPKPWALIPLKCGSRTQREKEQNLLMVQFTVPSASGLLCKLLKITRT